MKHTILDESDRKDESSDDAPGDIHMPPDKEEDFERLIIHGEPEDPERPLRIPPAPPD